MGELGAYAALIRGQFRSLASYRLSFAIEMLSNVGTTALDIITVVVLFSTSRFIAGFTLPQALLIASLSSLGFALADVIVGNVDHLRLYVRTGLLDVVLVRPLGALGQLLSMDLPFRKALRCLLSLAVLVVAVRLNDIDWTAGRVLLIVAAPIAGLVFFGSIFVLTASLAFWWVDSGEIGSSFTYGGRDFTSYPMPVFAGWFRAVFAYALGFAFVSYQPALVLLGRTDPLGLPTWAGYVSPLVALVVAANATVVWRAGVRQYRSTGS